MFKKILHKAIETIYQPDATKAWLQKQLKYASDSGIISASELEMIEGVTAIGDKRARDVMIPYSQMDAIPCDYSKEEVIALIAEEMHSRYPVVDEANKVIGILFVKDLIANWAKELHPDKTEKEWDLKQLCREQEFIPESTKLSILLKDFRIEKRHIGIVVDEHNDEVGLITIEDILEQIVGEIQDEHDSDEELWILNYGPIFSVKGQTQLEKFNEYFGTTFEALDCDTIGGFILSRLSYMPSTGEELIIDDYIFQVIQADSRRIQYLSVLKKQREQIQQADTREK